MIEEISGRYKPDGSFVEGGFGAVIFCDDTHLDRKVAIKIIKDDCDRRRMSDEVEALLQLRSKHVVQVYDVMVFKSGKFGIVEEYIDGQDLFESAVPRRSLEDYLKTLWQIASGITDIHSSNLIHRDIKPNNIKLNSEGIIKIFDFGLAREEGPAARTVGFVGTPGFAAPEQLFGGKFTKAVDTYAFGVTALYILKQGLPPSLRERPPKSLSVNPFVNLPIGLAVPVANVLWQCLEFEPNRRPDMEVVRDILARHLLFNRHQALAVHRGKPLLLNADAPLIQLSYPGIGSIDIRYNGFAFQVSAITGEVFVNNTVIMLGDEIPGSCVVALGGSVRGPDRQYITFDVSYPEVVL